MIKRIYIEGLVWFFLSLFLGVKSIQLGLGHSSSPGPGFIPFILALCLFLLAMLLSLQPILSRKEIADQKVDLRINAFYVASAVGMYVFVFKKIGFLLSTFLLMTFLFRAVGTKRWTWILAEAVLVTLLAYLFFGVIFKLNLPAGILKV